MTGRHGTRCVPDAFGRCVSALDQEPRLSARPEASRPLQPKPSAPRIHLRRRLPPHSKPGETGLEYLPDAAPRQACRAQRQTALRAEANASKSRQSPPPCAPSKPIRQLAPPRAQPESAANPPATGQHSENFSDARCVSTSGPSPRERRFIAPLLHRPPESFYHRRQPPEKSFSRLLLATLTALLRFPCTSNRANTVFCYGRAL